MINDSIKKAFKTAKEANSILTEAGGNVLKTSFDTAKQMAGLYKDAGTKAFDISKEVVTKTVGLAVENQKEVLKTSGEAIKAAAKSIRDGIEPELRTMTNARAKKKTKK